MTKKVQSPYSAWIGIILLLTLASCSQEVEKAPESKETDKSNASAKLASESEGTKLFRLRCSTCHSLEAGKGSAIGPQLSGVVGRAVGSFEGFSYSKALKDSDMIWTHESLDEFLQSPAKFFPGNHMAFGGLSDPNQRKLLIEYLEATK